MSLNNAMNNSAALKEAAANKLYANSRKYRTAKKVAAWKTVPEIGKELGKLDEAAQGNAAIMLTKQYERMKRLTETQLSNNFQNFSAENMLRMVVLSMPNCIRSKVFTEFAMETANDSIKYARPVYSKTGKIGARKSQYNDEENLFTEDDDFNSTGYQKALYEDEHDRATSSLIRAASTSSTELEVAVDGDYDAIDGYGVIFIGKESNPIAIQNGTTKWYINPEFAAVVTGVKVEELTGDKKGVKLTLMNGENTVSLNDLQSVNGPDGTSTPYAGLYLGGFYRFNFENDLKGDYLTDVELRISNYRFRPTPTAIGVSWSELSEVTFATSYDSSVEDYLVSFASQEIRTQLDYRAVRIAYNAAKMNPGKYIVEFNAMGAGDAGEAGKTLNSYKDIADTFSTAVAKVGDMQFNRIRRGGVTNMVGGPSAITYLSLCSAYSPKGKTLQNGPHKFGELDGVGLYKVPSDVIPSNEILTVFKNPLDEADVGVVFGVLVPFFSTGIIQRKTFACLSAESIFLRAPKNEICRDFLQRIPSALLTCQSEEHGLHGAFPHHLLGPVHDGQIGRAHV